MLGADERRDRGVEHLACGHADELGTGEIVAAVRARVGLVGDDLAGILARRKVLTGRTGLLASTPEL